jgi:hypothetical protein
MPTRNAHDLRALAALRVLGAEQHGVISRAQAREVGLSEGGMERARTRWGWRSLHRGVWFTGSGTPDLLARMWAAHLALQGAGVVAGRAAGLYWGLLGGELAPAEPILMLVPTEAHRVHPGLRFRRVPDPAARAHPARTPSVLTVEHTVLDLVRVVGSEAQSVEIVLRACRLRLTTPDRLGAVMAGMPRVPGRRLLTEVCHEVAQGVTSPLERRYRRDVAIRHRLPVGRAQVRAAGAGGVVYRDILIEEYGTIIELDGRLGHEEASDVFRDQWRDNSATLTGLATLRYGWLAIAGFPCSTADQVATLLTARGSAAA